MYPQEVVSATIATDTAEETTVTTEEHELEFPFKSDRLRTTVFGPRLPQLNVVGVTDAEREVQLSTELLSTAVVVTVAVPVLSNCNVMFWQIAVGPSLSETVIVKLHVVELDDTSVAAKVLVVVPTGNAPPLGKPVSKLIVVAEQLSTPTGVA